MGQQHAAGNIANGENERIGGFLFVVDLDEASFVLFHLGVFQTQILATRHAPHRNQDAVVKFFLLHLVRPQGDGADFFPLGGHLGHLGIKAKFAKILLRVLQNRAHQIRIGPGQDGGQGLDHHDFAAEIGINTAKFHADVAAADDQ